MRLSVVASADRARPSVAFGDLRAALRAPILLLPPPSPPPFLFPPPFLLLLLSFFLLLSFSSSSSMASDSSVDLTSVDALELLPDNTAVNWRSYAQTVTVLFPSVISGGLRYLLFYTCMPCYTC
ncbi:hypothetical protein CLOM_g23457 [Closterium sp. NIES-68]|nr:hypothetical protein CLOM_g23457 [Closterium sp. NIES-68]